MEYRADEGEFLHCAPCITPTLPISATKAGDTVLNARCPRLHENKISECSQTSDADNVEFLHSFPQRTPRLLASAVKAETPVLTPRTPRSHWASDPISSEIKHVLRAHQAEVMAQLQEWIARHEERLLQTMMHVEERGRYGARDFQRQNSPTVKLRRAASHLSNFSVASAGSIPVGFDVSSRPSLRSNKRRPSVGSQETYESEGDTKYISVEELRDQCQQGSGSFIMRSGTFVDKARPRWRGSAYVHKIVNTFLFEACFATLICINSILLGVEVGVVSSSPKEDVPHIFYYFTIGFSGAFLFELIMRLVSEGGLISFLLYSELRAWNWFDLFVVTCSLVEVGFNFVLLGGGSQSITRIMRMARMTRLGRVLRIARIVRFVSQLRVLVISIVSTLQTLLWALFLLMIIIYVFAVLLAQATAEHFSEYPAVDLESLVGDNERLEHYWGSLQAAMYTLFMSIAGGVSWEVAVHAIGKVHWIWGAFFTCFVAFASFALINVMTAVFCQSAIESAQRNMDVRWQAMCSDKRKHIDTLKELFKTLDDNSKGTINVRKLQKCWGDEAMQSFLNSMELAPDDCWTFFAILDKQDKEVNAADFVEGCLRLRGHAKAFDVAVMTFELRHLSRQTIFFMNQMKDNMKSIKSALEKSFISFEGTAYLSESASCSEPGSPSKQMNSEPASPDNKMNSEPASPDNKVNGNGFLSATRQDGA